MANLKNSSLETKHLLSTSLQEQDL